MGKTAYRWASQHVWAMRQESLQVILDAALGYGEDIEALEERLGRNLDNTQTVTYREGRNGSRVATLPLHGPIFRYANLFTQVSGATSNEIAARDFRAAMDDPKVKALILDIDSPGGEVNGTNAMANLIFQGRGTKPIISHVTGMAASAGYWIASSANKLVIDPTAMVGSIGAVMSAFKDNPEPGEHEFVSSASPLKRVDPSTKEGKEKYQGIVDSTAEVFIDAVARNMGVTAETVAKDFGQGGIKIGKYAVEAGMAHSLGSYEDVMAELLSGKERIISLPRRTAQGDRNMNPENEDQTVAIEAQLAEVQAQMAAVSAQLADANAARIAAEERAAQVAETARKEKIEAEATAFAAKLSSENKIQPAQTEQVSSLYAMLADLGEAPLGAFTAFAGSLKADSTDLGEEVVAAHVEKIGAVVLAGDDKAEAINDDDVVARMNAQRGHTK